MLCLITAVVFANVAVSNYAANAAAVQSADIAPRAEAGACMEAGGVDFAVDVGEIRPLNGLCNLAPLAGSRKAGIGERVTALKIPYYRHHDAALQNPGLRLLDVSRVFPLFHLDANDPRNYDFRGRSAASSLRSSTATRAFVLRRGRSGDVMPRLPL